MVSTRSQSQCPQRVNPRPGLRKLSVLAGRQSATAGREAGTGLPHRRRGSHPFRGASPRATASRHFLGTMAESLPRAGNKVSVAFGSAARRCFLNPQAAAERPARAARDRSARPCSLALPGPCQCESQTDCGTPGGTGAPGSHCLQAVTFRGTEPYSLMLTRTLQAAAVMHSPDNCARAATAHPI